MKNIIPLFLIGMFLVSLVSASQQSLGTFKQGECVNLIQICDNCSYNNITSVLYPNSTFALNGEVAMDKSGTLFNYTFCSTSEVGQYIVNGHGDLDGVDTAWNYVFYINPTGLEQKSILQNSILIMLILLSLVFLGLGISFRIPSLGFIGSVILIIGGVYAMIYGFNDVTNLYTRVIGIVLIGLGFIFMFVSAYEWLPWGKYEEY